MIDLVRFWLDLGFDGFRLDAVPYLYQRDGTAGEHLPETHAFIKRIRKQTGGRLPGPHPAGRGQRLAERRGRLLRRRRRVPPVLPLPAHAPPLHGGAARAALPHHRDPGPDARSSTTRASGPSSCATTTSSRSRGQRRGARLPHRRVRQGPADEAPHGDRSAAGPPARQRPAHHRAALRAVAVAARAARSSTTATSC